MLTFLLGGLPGDYQDKGSKPKISINLTSALTYTNYRETLISNTEVQNWD